MLTINRKNLTNFERQNHCLSEWRLMNVLFPNMIMKNDIIDHVELGCCERLTPPPDDDDVDQYYQYFIVDDIDMVDIHDLYDHLPFDIYYDEGWIGMYIVAMCDFGTNRELVHGLDLDLVEVIE